MADKSNIEWTDATWNPIVGCSIKSPGCKYCYAMPMAERISRMTEGSTGLAGPYGGLTKRVNGKPVWTGALRFVEHKLTEPLRWKKPRMIFVVFSWMRRSLDDGKDANFTGVLAFATHLVVDTLRDRGMADADIRAALVDEREVRR